MDPVFVALEEHYPDVIARMPAEFNSHQFIQKLMYKHQHLYVKVLAQYADHKDSPF